MAYTDIDKPSDYFDTKLYTGDNTNNRQISLDFSPDFTWIKARNAGASHILFDRVRTNANYLLTNATNAEVDGSSVLGWTNTGCTTNSFTVDLGSNGSINGTGTTFVGWNWLAGGTAVSNTDGSITSSVSANTTSGFSIVSWTGTGANGTIGHGLASAPQVVIVKDRSAGFGWLFGHNSLGSWTRNLKLNETIAFETFTSTFNSTAPTSSVFSIGSSGANNGSGNPLIAYCFAEKKGFSKFGSYTGNNSTNGPMIYTGFKPAWLLIKATNAAQWWTLLDSKRDTYNQASLGISPNSSDTESTFNTNRGPHYIDFLSNGFKIRTDNSGVNGTNSFIYAAFAENPFTTSTGIPATAR